MIFEFRKDSFDRLQNEAAYLSDMNGAEDYKRRLPIMPLEKECSTSEPEAA